MTLLYLLCGTLAALAFYLSTTHQRLCPSLRAHARLLRLAGWCFVAISLLAATWMLGPWAGSFAAFTVLMLVMVALPYADAWLQRKDVRHGR